MLIINADDWGRSKSETDAALECVRAGRVTCVSAMVFMQDSERAAELARQHGLDVGLHLNFAERFTCPRTASQVSNGHDRLVRSLMRNKYAHLLYHPRLRSQFVADYQAQAREFERLYGRRPSHLDGHHHLHLSSNVVFGRVIPLGTKIRRNFSFWPGEKSVLNRGYRRLIDYLMARRYQLPDYFFCLSQCLANDRLPRVAELARSFQVELMTHPVVEHESRFLLGHEFVNTFPDATLGGYLAM